MEEDKKLCLYTSYMDTLPLDFISNILSRLPVTCLVCLKCVCKSWLTMINTPEFAHSHFLMSLASNPDCLHVFSGLVENYTEEEEVEICEFDFYSHEIDSTESQLVKLPLPRKFEVPLLGLCDNYVVGSCNGLVCLLLLKSEIILLNPSTMTFYKICKALRCPNGSNAYYGFGYDHLNDDYKLVRVSNGLHRDVRVYSLKSNTWKLIKEGNSWGNVTTSCSVLINNHLLHWTIWHPSEKRGRYGWAGRPAIVCFDLCNEQWCEVPIPDDLAKAEVETAKLGNFDGCLCLLTETSDREGKLVDVWVMKEYGVKESWVKLEISHSGATKWLAYPPIAYSKGGQEILVMKHDKQLLQFCWYNLEDKTLRNTGIRVWTSSLSFVICWRSLFSFRGGKKFGAEML